MHKYTIVDFHADQDFSLAWIRRWLSYNIDYTSIHKSSHNVWCHFVTLVERDESRSYDLLKSKKKEIGQRKQVMVVRSNACTCKTVVYACTYVSGAGQYTYERLLFPFQIIIYLTFFNLNLTICLIQKLSTLSHDILGDKVHAHLCHNGRWLSMQEALWTYIRHC